MADEQKRADANAEPGAPRSDAADGGPGAADDAARVDELEGQVANLTDRLLRAHAELDNLRKRAEREREETAKYAITRFARDIVSVADNFERAIQAVPAGAADADPALKSLFDGVSITERELMNVLDRFGVKRIVPKGEAFNPHQHQAMMEIENPDVASGTVLEVYQPGYMIEDRILRPAMVVVAKGGAKPGKSASEGPAAAASEGPSARTGGGGG